MNTRCDAQFEFDHWTSRKQMYALIVTDAEMMPKTFWWMPDGRPLLEATDANFAAQTIFGWISWILRGNTRVSCLIFGILHCFSIIFQTVSWAIMVTKWSGLVNEVKLVFQRSSRVDFLSSWVVIFFLWCDVGKMRLSLKSLTTSQKIEFLRLPQGIYAQVSWNFLQILVKIVMTPC